MKPFLFLACTVVLIWGCQQNPKPSNHSEEVSFTTLFKKDSSMSGCFRIPAMVTAPNGDIIVAADDRIKSCGDLKWNKDINIVIRRSSDQGKTWSDIETLVDYPLGQSASDPSMIVDKITNTIFLFFNFMDLEQEYDVYYLRYITSKDNGKTWSTPVDITEQIIPPERHHDFQFITSGRGTQTQDGKLLHTLVNLDEGCFVFGSNDHGNSWYLIEKPLHPANESKIIELKDGTWMINSRMYQKGIRYIHCSKDEGQTWESHPDSALIDPSCNASLIRYQLDGKDYLIFSNANDAKNRINLTLKISTDNGKTWSRGKAIYAKGTAYSTMTALPDGRIAVVFEKDDYQEIVYTVIALKDLLD